MSDIILNTRYRNIDYNSNKKEYISFLNYYEREEACDKTVKIKNALGYYEFRNGSTGGFNKNGDLDIKEATKKFEMYKPNKVYQSVISFTPEFAKEFNIDNRDGMKTLMSKTLDNMYKQLGFDPKNIEWGGYFHNNTEHPHVHIWMFEKKERRKDGFIHPSKFNKGRSAILSGLEMNTSLYVEQDNYKKEILNKVLELKDNEEKAIKKELGTNSLFEIKGNINKQLGENKLFNMFIELDKKLPKDMKKYQYGDNRLYKYRKDIDKLVKEIMKDDSIAPVIAAYKKVLNKTIACQNKIYGDDKNLVENKKYYKTKMELIEKNIANKVLKGLRDIRKEKDNFYRMKYSEQDIDIYLKDKIEKNIIRNLNSKGSVSKRFNKTMKSAKKTIVDETIDMIYSCDINPELSEILSKTQEEINRQYRTN